MSLAVFYCLSTLLLFIILFTYTSTYIVKRRPSFVDKIQKQIIKTHFEQLYNLNSYQDSMHR